MRRLAALAVAPLLLAAGLMAFGGGHASAAAQAAQPTPSQTCILIVICIPSSPSPTPTPSSSTAPSAAPSASAPAAPTCPGDGHADRRTRRVRFGGRHAVRGQPVPHGEPVSVTVPVTDAAQGRDRCRRARGFQRHVDDDSWLSDDERVRL